MDTTLQYLPIMIVGFAASLGLTPVSRQIAMRLGVVDKPNAPRKTHKDHKPMMGGLAIYVAFAVSLLVFSPPQHIVELGAIVGGAGLLSFIGLLDDRYDLGVRIRFLVMFLAAGILVIAGIQIRLFNVVWLDVPITLIWIVALTNSLNFLDNMDGLSAGLASIGSFFFLVIALLQGQWLVSMLAAALFGSAVGFLAYNFNPASTFMGDMGALVLGFILAALAIKLNFGTYPLQVSWMVPVLVLAVPICDINLVVWTRIFEGRPPMEAGRDHMSHRLLSIGLSPRQVLLTIYSTSVLFALIGVCISLLPAATSLILGVLSLSALVLLFGVMVWIRERYQKREVSHG